MDLLPTSGGLTVSYVKFVTLASHIDKGDKQAVPPVLRWVSKTVQKDHSLEGPLVITEVTSMSSLDEGD